jgi:ferritin-like metal-binding protein YciE
MKTNSKNTSTATKKNTKAESNGNSNGSSQSPTYLQKFFIDQLKDIYWAENELLKGLTTMKKSSTTEELEDAFDNHYKQTERHIQRLEKVFKLVGRKAQGKKCEAMAGLLKEAESIIEETEEGSITRDAALIVAAQKVEHYEIATYGGLVQLALTMGLQRAAELLDKTLQEEEETDDLLTNIAEGHINIDAEKEGDYVWEQEEELEEA